ncbi:MULTISPECIES: hypothetical protein [Metallosphaera]|uniref:Uncharacterized protein n=3 Tax=Metallosphaera TaxID=41980 RepID=A4YIV0_METS5|nr:MULTISPECIES: hypothetical protein [Metallosphaera]ABP96352.1 hypothetical protein Msed_2214 [Metallosphaera sedula DSM 5348]AIM28335.1 hypothetical protein HA72_2214 [Metallosphaera sedula]AKV75133.1 hypothetical protein MsedA_2269 [Metallosphaera sedula]AKV77371.1 hypothetical protein MsedB_2271 [Metallosphaera sedula]AKV79622.1 hypothetical protein MsedC_2269 [Metallosphaera sedula]
MNPENSEEEKKPDIKSLVNIIPPASALRGREKETIKEKRVKVRKRPEVKSGTVLVSSKLVKDMGIKGEVEISVKGKRARFKALTQDSLPEIEIWASPEDMLKLGIEDNSTVTMRSV